MNKLQKIILISVEDLRKNKRDRMKENLTNLRETVINIKKNDCTTVADITRILCKQNSFIVIYEGKKFYPSIKPK